MGPGNCLIDAWVRKNKKGNFDKDGAYAAMGKTNDLMLNQALDNFDNRPDKNRLSFDTKDFDINFLRGLSFEDGASTIVLLACIPFLILVSISPSVSLIDIINTFLPT